MELFLSVFFLIYTSAHLYVFLKARAALGFGISAGIPLAVFMLIMSVAPLLVFFSEKYHQDLMARLMSYIGYTWMGVLFLFVCIGGVVDLYHGIIYLISLVSHTKLSYLTPSAKTSFYTPLILALAMAIYGYFEARNVRTEKITINTAKLPHGMKRLKIVQISDVHIGLIVRKRRLKNIIDRVKEADPDILVSTGDLVDGQINGLSGLAELFKEIKPRYGKFAITGNHEFYAGIEHAMNFTRSAGFRVLRGEGITVKDVITVIGIDDQAGGPFRGFKAVSEKALLSPFTKGRFARLEKTGVYEQDTVSGFVEGKEQPVPAEFILVLRHRPIVDKESIGQFDLQLSGHTHKGQLFPFRLITKLSYIIDAGYLDLGGNSALYVNRGAGTWGPPMRLMSPPEITIIELNRL